MTAPIADSRGEPLEDPATEWEGEAPFGATVFLLKEMRGLLTVDLLRYLAAALKGKSNSFMTCISPAAGIVRLSRPPPQGGGC